MAESSSVDLHYDLLKLIKSGVYLRAVSLLCIVLDSVSFIEEFQIFF